ncbi:MAG: hypothetical protein CMF22_11915 [Idiomarinaceae bacterium]|nr:hypothetical protein [Idiomarinaceae bacterium]|tara:strand:+ start:24424 stop:24975 length:552 start_codon:yes stop_codon:yes gene_type:complete
MKNAFPASELKNLFDYDPATGVATWKTRDETSPYWTQRAARRFNTRHAGKQAGRVAKSNTDAPLLLVALPDGKVYPLHRVIYTVVKGEWPDGKICHKNDDRTDNRWENLMLATQGDLNHRAKLRTDNSTGIRGVSWIESRGYYEVRTTHEGRSKTATTDSLEEAIKIKNQQLKLFGFDPIKEK